MCVIPVFWSVTPCNVIVFVGNEDGVNRFLTKIGTSFLNKVTSGSKRPTQKVLEVLMYRF